MNKLLDRFVDTDLHCKTARCTPLKILVNSRDITNSYDPGWYEKRELKATFSVGYTFAVCGDKQEDAIRRAYAKDNALKLLANALYDDVRQDLAYIEHAVSGEDWGEATRLLRELRHRLDGGGE